MILIEENAPIILSRSAEWAARNDILRGPLIMSRLKHQSSGFTLIASLLLLLLLSGMAIGLMMMVTTETKVGGTNLENNTAYHAAEGGIEKMSADLAATFQNAQSPTARQICDLGNLRPNMTGVTWMDYSMTPASGCSSALTAHFGQISAGPNQGLWAQIIPVTMLATAAEPGGQEVSMVRQAQVALIPVFQFGVFSDSDLGFYSSPDLDFAGRVHTNGDLYLGVANCCELKFHDKLSAYGNVVRRVLPNGLAASSYNDTGTVWIPTAGQGCDGTHPPHCRAIAQDEGSVAGAGGNPPQSSQNAAWQSISLSAANYNGLIIDADYGLSNCGASGTAKCGTGAKKLAMPFVNGTTHPYELIRRPPAGESSTSVLGQSREYNMAQIRVLLSDDPADLPGGAASANNVRLANVVDATNPSNPYGIVTSLPTGLPAPPAGSSYVTYFAAASNAIPLPSTCAGTTCNADWPSAPATPAAGAQTLVPTGPPAAPTYANNGTPAISLCPPNDVFDATKVPYSPALPANCPMTGAYPYYSPPNEAAPSNSSSSSKWNLIDGYLSVQYKNSSGNWNDATMEWLQLGFARGLAAPKAPGGSSPPAAESNTVNPDAILLVQAPADRNGDNTLSKVGTAPSCSARKSVSGTSYCKTWTPGAPPEVATDAVSSDWRFATYNSAAPPATQSITQYNWYPINFYDAREGEPRDTDWNNNSCTANGVMNAVEIDVGNLKRWLAGQTGTNGRNVDYVAQNGYVLYFSDRRGMLPNPNAPYSGTMKSGDSGLEDVVNAGSDVGTPNGTLQAAANGQPFSPEDVNQNTLMDNFGAANLGLGFYNGATNINGQIIGDTPDNPYSHRITSCSTTARKNWVSGARHVLKLVDGALGNVPLRTDTGNVNTGGFTVASENPVYIQGNYNSAAPPTDTFWSSGTDVAGHAATGIIADAVTVLSNSWDDRCSLLGCNGSTDLTKARLTRKASTTYYRVAIAGGKNMNFPFPAWTDATDYGFGTDGGVHNFLRFLEDWQNTNSTLNYAGSLVSLYYATYNTGLFKCCTYSVYEPPVRNYIFDQDFSNPSGLPPGTPLFRDVDSLGYRQLFTPRTN